MTAGKDWKMRMNQKNNKISTEDARAWAAMVADALNILADGMSEEHSEPVSGTSDRETRDTAAAKDQNPEQHKDEAEKERICAGRGFDPSEKKPPMLLCEKYRSLYDKTHGEICLIWNLIDQLNDMLGYAGDDRFTEHARYLCEILIARTEELLHTWEKFLGYEK